VAGQVRRARREPGAKLKALEGENAKRKSLLAEAMLDNAALKEVAAKTGEARRGAAGR
jgi:putative transposase